MSVFDGFLARVRSIGSRRRAEERMDEEFRFHLEMETDQLVARGVDPAEARRRAMVAFGGVDRHREEMRDGRGARALEDLLRDLRVGARGLRAQPALAFTAIVTLALGIGATAAVVGAARQILVAPLPYTAPDRIVTLWQQPRSRPDERIEATPGDFLDWRERARTLEHVAAAEPYSFDWIGPDGPERFETWLVTEGFFEALGARTMLGRTFRAEEFTPGRDNVVVLSHALWRTRFAADSSLVGRTLLLDTVPRVVIGVMPPGIDLPHGSTLWAPKIFRGDERTTSRTSAYYTAIARLRPGQTLEAAGAEMRAIAADLEREYPRTNAERGVTVVPLTEALFGRIRGPLLVLLGAVGCVLLVACLNVASLLLARAVRREPEFALRTALGASRGRLVRQLLAEATVLAVAGGVAGAALAAAGTRAIRALAPVDLPRADELRADVPLLLVAMTLSLVTVFAFGLAPALHAVRGRLRGAMASDGRAATASRPRGRLRAALVIAEFALSLVLVVGAALLIRSFAALTGVAPGFRADGVSVVTLQAWSYYPTNERRAAFAREATARLASLPGVEHAAVTSSLPLSVPIGAERAAVSAEGREAEPSARQRAPRVAAVTPDYLDALDIPLRAGRRLAPTDHERAAPVALVSEALARRLWNGEDPIGRRVVLRFMGPPLAREVVGVVGDVRHEGLDAAPDEAVYVPHAQGPTGAMHLVVRVTGDAAAALPAIQRELRAMNGVMPLTGSTTLARMMDDSLRERRFHLVLLSAFAALALVLAAVGIYGVTSYAVSERTRELGIRMALGARGTEVVGLVLRRGLAQALVGTLAGALAAAVLTRVLAALLYGVTPLDPWSFVGGAGALLVAAALACWLPARRAATVDPARTLRGE